MHQESGLPRALRKGARSHSGGPARAAGRCPFAQASDDGWRRLGRGRTTLCPYAGGGAITGSSVLSGARLRRTSGSRCGGAERGCECPAAQAKGDAEAHSTSRPIVEPRMPARSFVKAMFRSHAAKPVRFSARATSGKRLRRHSPARRWLPSASALRGRAKKRERMARHTLSNATLAALTRRGRVFGGGMCDANLRGFHAAIRRSRNGREL
jgi:hypothetical protein